MTDESKAVAVRGAVGDTSVDRLRKAGGTAVALARERARIQRAVKGTVWGRGLQPAQIEAATNFLQMTGANPLTHIDNLAGTIYLNANYWMERCALSPLFVDYSQTRLTLEDNPELWKHYGPPDTATHVYETTIRRYRNAAPIDAIKEGRVPFDEAEKWIVEVKECNWVDPERKNKNGKYDDPVGRLNPATTARTRSLRRCAIRALPAVGEQVVLAENILEADFTVLDDGAAVTVGAGEPMAATPEEIADALKARRQQLQAAFGACGLAGDAIVQWVESQGLPPDSLDWNDSHFDRALAELGKLAARREIEQPAREPEPDPSGGYHFPGESYPDDDEQL